MANEVNTRRALVLAMQPAGTVMDGLWAGMWPAVCAAYRSVWSVAGEDVLADTAVWRRVQSERGLRETPRVNVPAENLAALHQRGAALAKKLAEVATDVIVCGNEAGMRSAARLALWTRSVAPLTRWMGVPCCPYNSVPFTVCSVGYASALRFCVRSVRQKMKELRGEAHAVEVAGDVHGWIGLGIAALAGGEDTGHGEQLRLGDEMPCAAFDARLGRALGRAMVQQARYAAPGIMLAARLRAGRGALVIEHLQLVESMYALREVPAQYVIKTSGRPAPAMREFAQRLCAPWRPSKRTQRGTRETTGA